MLFFSGNGGSLNYLTAVQYASRGFTRRRFFLGDTLTRILCSREAHNESRDSRFLGNSLRHPCHSNWRRRVIPRDSEISLHIFLSLYNRVMRFLPRPLHPLESRTVYSWKSRWDPPTFEGPNGTRPLESATRIRGRGLRLISATNLRGNVPLILPLDRFNPDNKQGATCSEERRRKGNRKGGSREIAHTMRLG